MANINCATLLEDIKMLLPSGNSLTDDQMLIVIKRIMAQVGSDEQFYGEVACKALRTIADINSSKANVEQGGLKREKVGDHEVEYAVTSSGGASWDDFKKSLNDLCPVMYGYSFKTTTGMVINTTAIPNPLCPPSYSAGYL